MNALKRGVLVICSVLVICTVVAAILLAALDDDDYSGILTWAVERFTDTKVSIEGPVTFDLSMEPSIFVSEISIVPDKHEKDLLSVHIGHIRTKIALKPLLSGDILIRELLVNDVTVSYVKDGVPQPEQSDEKTLREKLADINIPIPENVTLNNINLSYVNKGADHSLNVLLHSLTSDYLRDKGQLYIKGTGTANNTDLSIDGQLGSVSDALMHTRPYPLEEITTDLKLHLKGPDTKLLRYVLFEWLPDTGPLSGEALLIGPLNRLTLKDINITAGKPKKVWINAQGRLDMSPLDPDLPTSDIDMALSIKSGEAPQLFTNLNVDIPDLKTVSAKARMHGSGDRLIFDGIDIQMTDPDGVSAGASGNFILMKNINGTSPSTLDLKVKINAENISTFEQLLAAKALPDLGPVLVTASIKGTTETLSLEDVLIQAGHPGPVQFQWKGRIGKVTFDSDEPASEVEIVSSFYAKKTSLFSPYVGFDIPDFGPVEGSSQIVARKGGYGADDLELIIGNKEDHSMKATGSVKYLMHGTSVALEGINMTFEVPKLESRIITEHLGKHEMDLGKISGNFSLTGKPEDLTLSNMEFSIISPEGLKISTRGYIKHILPGKENPVKGIKMELSATAPGMSAIEKITDMDFPDLGPLSMSANINDRDGKLNFEKFQLRTGPEKEPTFLVEFETHDILSMEHMDLSVSYEAAIRPWLEEFYGHSVPEDHRLKGEATLSGSGDLRTIKGSAYSGKTQFMTTIELSRVNEQKHIAVKISSPKIYLDDLGIYPEVREQEDSAIKDKSVSHAKIFSDEPFHFENLKKLNLSFSFDAEELIGRDFNLQDLDFDVMIKDGFLRITLAKLSNANGFVTAESSIDTRGPKPEIALNMKAKDIDIANLLAHIHTPLLLSGHLKLAADLRGIGSSPREIASSLNGDLEIMIENGQIKSIADLMGADAIDFVTAVRKTTEYTKLNCLAAGFSFTEGIGKSKVIYIDTPSVRSKGIGTLDLQEESIDIAIHPKPKKRMVGGSSPVTIIGPLNSPSAKKLPFIEASRLYGEIFMPYVFLPARALGYMWFMMKDDKDEHSPCLKFE